MNLAIVINKLQDFLSSRLPTPNGDFSCVAFDVLKTMMLLAAVDGEISRGEMTRFWECAREVGSFPEDELRDLWKASLCSAGYLSLQAKVSDRDACVAEFVRLADESLMKKLAASTPAVRNLTMDCLNSMANADGDFSEIEKLCISALTTRLGKMIEKLAVSAIRL